jgi:hypothetical protein
VLASVEMEMAGLLAPPTRFTADSVTWEASFLSWDDNSANEDGFIIERNDGEDFSLLATVEANTASYADLTVVPEATYEYRLRAYNEEDTSIYSKILTVEIPAEETPDNTAEAKTRHVYIYPIPSNGILYIEFACEPLPGTEIEIYDMLGNRVLTEKIYNTITKLDCPGLADGVYCIRITDGATKTLYANIFTKSNM